MNDVCHKAGQIVDCALAFPDYGYSSANKYIYSAMEIAAKTEEQYNMPPLTVISILVFLALAVDVYCRKAGIE